MMNKEGIEEDTEIPDELQFPENSTQMGQRENGKGGGRFKIFKDVLENTELTIFEMMELMGVIVRVCDRESKRMKLQLLEKLNLGTDTGSEFPLPLPSYSAEWTNAVNLVEAKAGIATGELWFRRNLTVGKQRGNNGQRSKIFNRIVENSSWTVSELDEFIGILLQRQRVYQQEADWTRQMEIPSDHGQVCLPPLPDIVLEKIFSYPSLTTNDILSSRSVCRHWWFLATKELRNRICKNVTFHSTAESSFEIPKHDSKKFFQVMMKSQLIPVTSFHIKGVEEADSDEMKNFLEIFAPSLRYLRLNFDSYEDLPFGVLKTYFEGIQLKKLEDLTFVFGRDNTSDATMDDIRTSLTDVCFGSAENLKKLKFQSDRNPVGFIKSLENSPLPHLNTLILFTRTLFDKELENLGLVVNLKRLSFRVLLIQFKSETMKGFLERQSKTLEYLKLFDSFNTKTEFVYEFPRMECVKVFHIASKLNIRFTRMDWNKFFPKLEELKMQDGVEYSAQSLFPADTRSKHLVLKIIDLPLRFGKSLSKSLSVIGQIFPNVHTVIISPHDFLYPILFNSFPNLKKIIFRFSKTRKKEEAKNYLLDCGWDMNFNLHGLPGVQGFFTRLTETGFEIKDYVRGEGGTRNTYDCTWFLRLLQQRIKLEQLDDELKAELELKKTLRHLNLDSEDTHSDMSNKNFLGANTTEK